jgi:hypothetical protein
MSHDIELQRPDGLDLGSVIHLRKSCADIAHIIGNKMREAIVKIIVFKQNKVPVVIDESMTVIGKVVLVVRLRIAAGDSRDPWSFLFDLEHVKCGPNAKAIHNILSNGESIMLEQRRGGAFQNYILTILSIPFGIVSITDLNLV